MNTEISKLLESDSTSYWLKAALQASLKRDALDALNDAETLARLLYDRLSEMHSN